MTSALLLTPEELRWHSNGQKHWSFLRLKKLAKPSTLEWLSNDTSVKDSCSTTDKVSNSEMYYLQTTSPNQMFFHHRQRTVDPQICSLQTENHEVSNVYGKFHLPMLEPKTTQPKQIDRFVEQASRQVYEIPIVRHTKTTNSKQWNVSVQTDFNFPLTAGPPPMHCIFEDIGLSKRSAHPTALWENLAEPRDFCASVDGISQITYDSLGCQEKAEENPHPIQKLQKSTLKRGAVITSKKTSRMNSPLHENRTKDDVSSDKMVQGKYKCQLVKAVELKRRESSELADVEQVYANIQLRQDDKEKRLSGSSPDLSLAQTEENSDPDWCYELGTNDDTSISEATNDADQLARGNMLFRFANVAKRKRILSSEDISKSETTKRKPLSQIINSQKENHFFSPSFLSKPQNVTVNPGDCAKFYCSCIGYPVPEVSWFLHDVKLTNDSRTEIKSKNGNHYLEIENVLPEESGTVKCLIENLLGKSEVYVQLWVNDPFLDMSNKTVRILTPLKNVDIPEGGNVRFKCKIFGEDFDIRWYHNGKVVVPDDRKTTDYKQGCATFELRKLRCSDTGVVTCLVTNTTGEDKTSGMLRVTTNNPQC